MEIERKFLIEKLPEMEPVKVIHIEQGYISTDPVIRIRAQKVGEQESYVLTVKGGGMIKRIEYELDLTQKQFEGLKDKCVGQVIVKTRYKYPLENGLMAEVDVFEGAKAGLVLAEVEFPDEKTMSLFEKPDWFGEDVSRDIRYHNSYMSLEGNR